MTQTQKPKGVAMICKRCGRGNTTIINPKTGQLETPWFYKGQSKYWAPCPRCKTTVKVPKVDNL